MLKDTEEKDDVCLSHKLGLAAAVDVTLKTHRSLLHTYYIVNEDILYSVFLSYNLSSAGVLVCIRWTSDVVPHLS